MTIRRPFDFYATPEWATEQMLTLVRPSGSALEPCAGDGAIASTLMRKGLMSVATNDIDASHQTNYNMDASDPAFWRQMNGRFDWIISNPPFSFAAAIVPQAHFAAGRGVAMFLRLSWLEPCADRVHFLRANPPTDLLVLPRLSFRARNSRVGRGTDSVTCAWFVWDKSKHQQRISIIPKDKSWSLFGEATA